MSRSALGGSLFLDSKFATVIATLTAYGVELDCGAAVGAYSESGSDCLVVRPTLVTASLRMVSLRMCHCLVIRLISRLYSEPLMRSRNHVVQSLRLRFLRASHRGSVS